MTAQRCSCGDGYALNATGKERRRRRTWEMPGPAQGDRTNLYDYYLLEPSCGLQIALWRFHERTLWNSATVYDTSRYAVHASRPEVEHAICHLGLPPASVSRTTSLGASSLVEAIRASFVVMRQDDNGNEFEVTRVTSRCEAEALAHRYEARGHKQLYWIESVG